MPRVTILLPTYEPHPEHIAQALQSFLAQTEQDWQLFIHDDGSNADVRSMVAPFMEDKRFHFRRSESRRGIGGNWNAAVADMEEAPYIQLLFQDDKWEPTYLERALAVMEAHPSVGFVSAQHHYHFEGECPVRDQYESVVAFRKAVAEGKHDGRKFLTEWMERGLHPNIVGEPSFVMLRRSVMEEVGPFTEDMPQFLDVEYWVRLLAASDWYNLAGDHGAFRVHPSGASEQNRKAGRGLFDRLRCMDRALVALPSSERPRARRAIVEHLKGMILKFRNRSQRGESTSGQGSSHVFFFALRHPILTIRAIIGAVGRGK